MGSQIQPMVGAGISNYCLTVKAVRVNSFKADLTASTAISDVEAVCIQQLFSCGTTAPWRHRAGCFAAPRLIVTKDYLK